MSAQQTGWREPTETLWEVWMEHLLGSVTLSPYPPNMTRPAPSSSGRSGGCSGGRSGGLSKQSSGFPLYFGSHVAPYCLLLRLTSSGVCFMSTSHMYNLSIPASLCQAECAE